MLDIERLQARAEDASIRSEMARTRLQEAQSNLRELHDGWSEASVRRSIARSVVVLDQSRPAQST